MSSVHRNVTDSKSVKLIKNSIRQFFKIFKKEKAAKKWVTCHHTHSRQLHISPGDYWTQGETIQTYSIMNYAIILSEKQMSQLQKCIIELKHNILHINDNLKRLHREHVWLVKDQKIKEDLIKWILTLSVKKGKQTRWGNNLESTDVTWSVGENEKKYLQWKGNNNFTR